MKHLFAAFLSLLALLALAAPACADAWQDPPSDRFFESHRGQCTYENRRYYANGKEGFITLWDAPGGSEVRARDENGEVLWTSCTYRSWALVSRREDRAGTAGWAKLSMMPLKSMVPPNQPTAATTRIRISVFHQLLRGRS